MVFQDTFPLHTVTVWQYYDISILLCSIFMIAS